MAIAAWQRSVLVAVIVTAVVLLHEVGHFVAMRLSGHRDARIFFVPFLGAVTTASSAPTSAMAHFDHPAGRAGARIVLGVVLLPLAGQPGRLRATAVFLLYLNVLNLLPIGFLDGGRVLSTLLLARSPKLEAAFQVVSAVPMAHLFGLGAESGGAVGGFAAGMLLTAVRGVRVGEAAAAVAPSLKGCTDLGAASATGCWPCTRRRARCSSRTG